VYIVEKRQQKTLFIRVISALTMTETISHTHSCTALIAVYFIRAYDRFSELRYHKFLVNTLSRFLALLGSATIRCLRLAHSLLCRVHKDAIRPQQYAHLPVLLL